MAMAVSNQQSRDAALLRATTELFVLAHKHDPDEIRRFEELATHFLAKVSAADRAFVAERIAHSADAPSSVLRMLGKDLVEIASPILRRSPALSEFDLLSIMASTGPQHYRLIATRAELSTNVVAALRLTGDAETIELVSRYPTPKTRGPDTAESPAVPPTAIDMATSAIAFVEPAKAEAHEVFATARAMSEALRSQIDRFSALPRPAAPTAAAEPATADDVPAAENFLALDREARLAVLGKLSGGAIHGRRSPALLADQAFRVALAGARVTSLARQKQRDALIRALSDGLRLDLAKVTALVEDPSGEPLVVLLKAIGLADPEAQQVLLFANPVMSAAVDQFFRLAALLAETGRPVADQLVEAWRRDQPAAAPAHAPMFADMELRRTLRPGPAATQAKPAEQALRDSA